LAAKDSTGRRATIMPTTHYHTLGVTPSATVEQIRRAYRALAKSLHPDVNPAKDAAAKFARIAAAYEVLSDARARREYDLSLAARAAPPPERSSSDLRQGHYVWVSVAGRPSDREVDISEVDELFDTFFGGGAVGGAGGAAKSRRAEKATKPSAKASNKQEPNKPPSKKPKPPRRSSG
jgi:molecular chaperone DnaJ